MKNTVALARAFRDVAAPWGLSARSTAANAGPQDLSPRLLWGTALAGELIAAVLLLASENVSPVLIRSLQLFLRF